MRQTQAIKRAHIWAALTLCAAGVIFPAHAGTAQTPPATSAQQQAMATAAGMQNDMTAQSMAQFMQAMGAQQQQQGQGQQQGQAQQPYALGLLPGFGKDDKEKEGEKKPAMTQKEFNELLKDPDSPQYKANELAKKSKADRDLEKGLAGPVDDAPEPPPPELIYLENLGHNGDEADFETESDALVKKGKDAAINMRRDAMRNAALSYGARGGLARRNFEIMERLTDFEGTLDRVFDFRALLIKAPSGMLIEPPIIRESLDALAINTSGEEAAVADKILDISKQAQIVSAPRDWRQYLVHGWTASVPPPPRLLWPQNEQERKAWKQWINEGWAAGVLQADQMFEVNINQVLADYRGMVRYRMLLTQGMVSAPYTLQEDRGVTGSKTTMRVGDRALRITGPSQFLTGSGLWKPADR